MRITDLKLCIPMFDGFSLECAALDHTKDGSTPCRRLKTKARSMLGICNADLIALKYSAFILGASSARRSQSHRGLSIENRMLRRQPLRACGGSQFGKKFESLDGDCRNRQKSEGLNSPVAAHANFCLPIGNARRRLPVAAKMALQSAGATKGTAASPMPPGASSLSTRCTSSSGDSLLRSNR